MNTPEALTIPQFCDVWVRETGIPVTVDTARRWVTKGLRPGGQRVRLPALLVNGEYVLSPDAGRSFRRQLREAHAAARTAPAGVM